MVTTIVFWVSAAFIVYAYAGYPLFLLAWARWVEPRAVPAPATSGEDTALSVSIIIAARNEAARLPARIRNLLSLDFPAANRQIIVVDDGSTDHTPQALEPFQGTIDFVHIDASGKAPALNAGVAIARHEVLVFADARQSFAPGSLRALVHPFHDERIGGVTGELVLGCESQGGRRCGQQRRGPGEESQPEHDRREPSDRRRDFASAVADGVGLYWRYEKGLRQLESTVGSTLGATGAIYALRRSLWRPLPPDTLLDDVLAPMRAVLAGYRVVFEPGATAFDHTAADSAAEGRRKVRTLAGNVQILWLDPRLLIPFVNPVWFQYMSHKVARLLVPYALLTLFASSIALSTHHTFYLAALLGQCAFYLLGGYGAWLEAASTQPDLATATAAASAAVDARS